MFFDTKSVLLAALLTTLGLVTLPSSAQAQAKFPFSVERDANGAITRIELPFRDSMMSEDEDVLSSLRVAVKDYQDSGTVGLTALGADAIIPQSADDKKLYAQAKAYLKNDFSASTLNDPQLILRIKLYRLLAAPNAPEAFDTEEALTELVGKLLSEAGTVLHLASPAYTVFEYLVGEYIGDLEQRRNFFQNQLLVLLSNDSTLFTDKEKSTIRSSIYYSRLGFDYKAIPKRVKARKIWATYGDLALAKQLVPCKGFVSAGDNGFGSCFKQSGDLFLNRMNKKSNISKDVSLAYDLSKPGRVHDTRILLMLAKFAVAMIPVNGQLKSPFKSWITSQYEGQRQSEGFFFAYATMRNMQDLVDGILYSAANPIIRN
jgi:hypothetical protein